MTTTYGWENEPTPAESSPQPPDGNRPAGGGGAALRLAIIGLAICLIGLIGGLGIGWSLARSQAGTGVATTATQGPITAVPQAGSTSAASPNLAALAAKVDPVVVDVNTVIQSANGSGSTAGTGIILTSSGEVLTNNHVVSGSTSITVTIAGRSGTYAAHVVGVDPTKDVALIQIEGVSGLPAATLADSSTIQVGEPVVAFGNALGRGGAPRVSQGSIVALDQSLTASDGTSSEHLTGMIQMDASIAPGDSGGPVVNSAGQVIGMITAGQSSGPRNTSTTVGFAIPTNTALAVVNQVRSGQASSEVILGQVGYLGVQVTDLNSRIAAQLGLSSTTGALVTGVVAGSPAESAGIGRYAVITAVAGVPIDSSAALGTALHSHKPGGKVNVSWIDSTGSSHTASITLTTGPAI
jgi:S1-C subfamily serine protease